jgi:hypothetical protein
MNKIIPKLFPITPMEIYVRQVQATYDAIRQSNLDKDYIPSQFGGIFGQGVISNSGYVLEVTEFDIGND